MYAFFALIIWIKGKENCHLKSEYLDKHLMFFSNWTIPTLSINKECNKIYTI